MIFLLALIPATMLSVAGLVAFFLAQRSEGILRTVGRFLGYWAFSLAVLVILGSVVVAARTHHPRGLGMRAPMFMGPRAALPGVPPGPQGPPPASPGQSPPPAAPPSSTQK